MRMDVKEIAARIAASPDRAEIEAALEELYGERDIRLVEDETLRTFVRLVLPELSPGTFGKGREHGKP